MPTFPQGKAAIPHPRPLLTFPLRKEAVLPRQLLTFLLGKEAILPQQLLSLPGEAGSSSQAMLTFPLEKEAVLPRQLLTFLTVKEAILPWQLLTFLLGKRAVPSQAAAHLLPGEGSSSFQANTHPSPGEGRGNSQSGQVGNQVRSGRQGFRCSTRHRASQASQENRVASQADSTNSQEGTPTPTNRPPQGSSNEEPNPKWVINLSSKPLTLAQRSVLAKGPNFVVTHKQPPN